MIVVIDDEFPDLVPGLFYGDKSPIWISRPILGSEKKCFNVRVVI
jgi:hypothetical protein